MNTNKNIDKLLEKLLSFGEEQVHNICFFMLNSGLRMKEVIDAKFSDIDFKTGTLQIVVPRSNLFNKEKVIKLNQISLTLLAKIRDQYPNDKWVFQSKNKKNQINSHPKALSYQSALNTIKKNSKHNLSLNRIRHAYATKYFYDTLCVKNTLGHESINMTSKYIKK
jgi:integrase